VDAIILNLIEFWKGDTLESLAVEMDDGTRITLARPTAEYRHAHRRKA